MISSYKILGEEDNLSIEYKNLYSINGEIVYISLLEKENLPYVNKFTNLYYWKPKVINFSSLEEVTNYLSLFNNRQEIDLSALGDNIWYGNIGHALFDGLYPIYLALVKFGYFDEDFTYLCSNWENKECLATEVMTTFSGRDLLEYNKLDKQKLIHFKTLVAGTGAAGNRIINPDYKLYGQNEYGALSLFKKRMLNRYSISTDLPVNKNPKAIIIHNKRYSEQEILTIKKFISHHKNAIEIKYVDWHLDYSCFRDQLKEIEDTDIHITGPGTGMLYMPFLKRGAVNINLGYIEKTQTNYYRPNIKIEGTDKEDFFIPGWMEQSVCAAADYVNTLYYNRYLNTEIGFEPINEIFFRSLKILGTCIRQNHNIDALVFKEYCKACKNPKEVCDYLTGIAFFIELFVNEHPKAVPKNLVDIELLRSIKQAMSFNRTYEIEL